MELQDQLEAIRAHRGTVRVNIGDYTVNADVMGTRFNEATDECRAFLGANLRLHCTQHELIRMQELVIDSLHHGGEAYAYVMPQQRTMCLLAETLDLSQTAQGNYLWSIGIKYFV